MEDRVYFTRPNNGQTMPSLLYNIEKASDVKWVDNRKRPTCKQFNRDFYVYVDSAGLTYWTGLKSGVTYLDPKDFIDKCAELFPRVKTFDEAAKDFEEIARPLCDWIRSNLGHAIIELTQYGGILRKDCDMQSFKR